MTFYYYMLVINNARIPTIIYIMYEPLSEVYTMTNNTRVVPYTNLSRARTRSMPMSIYIFFLL